MKKFCLAFAILFQVSLANASVCIIEAYANNGISDHVYRKVCDGKFVEYSSSQKDVSVTRLIQELIDKGYKIVGQSNWDGSVIWTLTK